MRKPRTAQLPNRHAKRRASKLLAASVAAVGIASPALAVVKTVELYHPTTGNWIATASCDVAFSSAVGPVTLSCDLENGNTNAQTYIYWRYTYQEGQNGPLVTVGNENNPPGVPPRIQNSIPNSVVSADRTAPTLSSPDFYKNLQWRLCDDVISNTPCLHATAWQTHTK